MTDYILILLAVACCAMQFASMKIYQSSVRQTTVTALTLLIVSNLAATLVYLFVGGFSVRFSWFSFFWICVKAIITIPYFLLGIKSLSLGSLAIYSMFMMLGGMILPFLYGVIFLNEGLSIWKIVGLILLTGFIVLQATAQGRADEEKKVEGKKNAYFFFIICLLIFLLNGATSIVSKAHQVGEHAVDEISFTVSSSLLTVALSALILGCSLRKRDKAEKLGQIKSAFSWKPFLGMIAVGVISCTGNFLLLKAASNVPASIQFPLVSGGVIVLSAIVSVCIFKEKLSKKEWISIAGAFLSTFLFAI